jgi:hypothetical protein
MGRPACGLPAVVMLLLLASTGAAPDFTACGAIPTDSVQVPGGSEVLRLHAVGTRNYTCPTPGGVAPIGDGQGNPLARLAFAGSSDHSIGSTFSSTEGYVTINIDDPSTGRAGSADMASDTAGVSPVFQPSPNNGSISWARWRVVDAGGEGILANVTYVARVNTSGGERPDRCPSNSTVATVPFQADYVMYACTSGGLVARLGALALAVAVFAAT